MRNLITTMAMLALIGSPAAMAQTGSNRGAPGATNPSPRVGDRQRRTRRA